MRIAHSTAPSLEGAQAEPLPYRDAEIRAGEMMGITVRSALNPEGGLETPVPLEVGAQIAELILNYYVEHAKFLACKLEEARGEEASRQALAMQKGGQGYE